MCKLKISFGLKYHLHDRRTVPGSGYSRIEVNLAFAAVNLHKLSWIGFLQTNKKKTDKIYKHNLTYKMLRFTTN